LADEASESTRNWGTRGDGQADASSDALPANAANAVRRLKAEGSSFGFDTWTRGILRETVLIKHARSGRSAWHLQHLLRIPREKERKRKRNKKRKRRRTRM